MSPHRWLRQFGICRLVAWRARPSDPSQPILSADAAGVEHAKKPEPFRALPIWWPAETD